MTSVLNEGLREHLKKHGSKYLAGVGALGTIGSAALGMSVPEHREKSDEAKEDVRDLEKQIKQHKGVSELYSDRAKRYKYDVEQNRQAAEKHAELSRLYSKKPPESSVSDRDDRTNRGAARQNAKAAENYKKAVKQSTGWYKHAMNKSEEAANKANKLHAKRKEAQFRQYSNAEAARQKTAAAVTSGIAGVGGLAAAALKKRKERRKS